MISRYGKYPLLLTERKGISDEVDKLANDVIRKIWEDSSAKECMLSPSLKTEYVEGDFKIDGFGGELSVIYVLYFFDTVKEYNIAFDRMNDSSSFDDKTNTLRICSGLISGELTYATYEEIYHELLHYFEYSKGLEKNVGLYDKATEFITKSVKAQDNVLLNVAKLVYYTFPHEQDAFAHQFYGFLKNMKPKEDFDTLLYSVTMFRAAEYSYRVYKKDYAANKKDIHTLLLYFGMDVESFNKRIHFGMHRLKKKLKQVYNRYLEETRLRPLPENLHRIYGLGNVVGGIHIKEERLQPWGTL